MNRRPPPRVNGVYENGTLVLEVILHPDLLSFPPLPLSCYNTLFRMCLIPYSYSAQGSNQRLTETLGGVRAQCSSFRAIAGKHRARSQRLAHALSSSHSAAGTADTASTASPAASGTLDSGAVAAVAASADGAQYDSSLGNGPEGEGGPSGSSQVLGKRESYGSMAVVTGDDLNETGNDNDGVGGNGQLLSWQSGEDDVDDANAKRSKT